MPDALTVEYFFSEHVIITFASDFVTFYLPFNKFLLILWNNMWILFYEKVQKNQKT